MALYLRGTFFIEFTVHFLLHCSFYSTTHFVFLLGKLCNIFPYRLNYACIVTINHCYMGETETSHTQFVYLKAAACATAVFRVYYGCALSGMLIIAYEAISC